MAGHTGCRGTAIQRFLQKIQFDDDEKCWEWKAGFTNEYGCFYPMLNGSHIGIKAHRYSYELFVDDIPKGLFIDHYCSNKKCVNPYHLHVVTKSENGKLAWERGEQPRKPKVTQCKRGHQYTTENTYLYKKRPKECLICRHDASRRSKLRRK